MGSAQKDNVFRQYWWLVDTLAVFFHLTFTIVLAFLPLVIVMFSQLMRSFYQTSASQDRVNHEDFTDAPWAIPFKLDTLRGYDIAILVASLVFIVLAFF